MKIFRLSEVREVRKVKGGASYGIKVLVDSNTAGSKNILVVVIDLKQGQGFRNAKHETSEETMFILEGEGIVEVDGETASVGRGTAIFIPAGCLHSLKNTGGTDLKALSAVSPPF